MENATEQSALPSNLEVSRVSSATQPPGIDSSTTNDHLASLLRSPSPARTHATQLYTAAVAAAQHQLLHDKRCAHQSPNRDAAGKPSSNKNRNKTAKPQPLDRKEEKGTQKSRVSICSPTIQPVSAAGAEGSEKEVQEETRMAVQCWARRLMTSLKVHV